MVLVGTKLPRQVRTQMKFPSAERKYHTKIWLKLEGTLLTRPEPVCIIQYESAGLYVSPYQVVWQKKRAIHMLEHPVKISVVIAELIWWRIRAPFSLSSILFKNV